MMLYQYGIFVFISPTTLSSLTLCIIIIHSSAEHQCVLCTP